MFGRPNGLQHGRGPAAPPAHLPMLAMAAPMHYRLVGMAMGQLMPAGMAALLIALPMAAAGWMLARSGIETRGHGLEAIQDALSRPS
ncbi:hypothetical protein [Rhodanobacter soli]|uniref:hypothetical protein n=1 Tax=Rhodanobacter soli TaxID=590609 RepID=UPI0031CFE1BD